MPQVDGLIGLVGKQPMPVLVPILQYRPAASWLIVTEETRKQADNLRKALRLLEGGDEVCLPAVSRQVDPYRSDQTRSRIAELVRRFGNKVPVINITGGTALMSLGASQAARDLGLPMLYVDTDEGQIIHLAPDGREENRDAITTPVTASVYLRAHGAVHSFNHPWGTAVREADACGWVKPFVEVARKLGQACSQSARLMDTIRCAYQQAGEGELPDPTVEEIRLCRMLGAYGMLADVTQLATAAHVKTLTTGDEGGARAREFLEGKWLELFVFDALLTSGEFDEVLFDVQVKHPVEWKTVENQLDVVVVRGSRLGVVSCKSQRLQVTDKDENKVAVYELDSLLQADLMGLYAAKVLVTNQASYPDALRSRARLSNICLVTGPDLPDLVRRVREVLE